MTNIGTPDWQRGIISPQKLLATVPAASKVQTVSLPPNVETLVVVVPEGPKTTEVFVTGVKTGFLYASQVVSYERFGGLSTAYYVEVSQAVDEEVEVELAEASAHDWYIYADAAVHIVHDPSSNAVIGSKGGKAPGEATQVAGTDGTDLRAVRTDPKGTLFTVPVAPSAEGGAGAPEPELQRASGLVEANGIVLAGPGAEQRYRLFYAVLLPFSSAINGYLYESASGELLAPVVNLAAVPVSFAPSGLPLKEDNGIGYTIRAGSGLVAYVIVYTTEKV